MKKTVLTLVMALFAIAAFAQNEENKSFIPNGYQGFLEESNCWHFDKNMPTTIQLSTTHGFYFNDHIYAGIGVGLEFNNDYLLMPFYTNVRYVFFNKKAVSPFVSMRLGSFISDNMGAYGDLALGVRFSSKKDFAVSVMVAGTYYDKLHYDYYYNEHYDEQGEWHYEYMEKDINSSGISLRVGIEW
jgi:hypothetical protein